MINRKHYHLYWLLWTIGHSEDISLNSSFQLLRKDFLECIHTCLCVSLWHFMDVNEYYTYIQSTCSDKLKIGSS